MRSIFFTLKTNEQDKNNNTNKNTNQEEKDSSSSVRFFFCLVFILWFLLRDRVLKEREKNINKKLTQTNECAYF